MYSEHNRVLLLGLGEGAVTSRILFATSAICGIGPRGELLELWMTPVALEADEAGSRD